MGLDPPSPLSTCVHLSPTPPPCGRHKWMAPYSDRIGDNRICTLKTESSEKPARRPLKPEDLELNQLLYKELTLK